MLKHSFAKVQNPMIKAGSARSKVVKQQLYEVVVERPSLFHHKSSYSDLRADASSSSTTR